MKEKGKVEEEWKIFTMILNKDGIAFSEEVDFSLWAWDDTNGILSAKKSYEAIVSQEVSYITNWYFLKIKCFVWLCIKSKLLG